MNLNNVTVAKLLKYFKDNVNSSAVILQDYNKGALTTEDKQYHQRCKESR
jgi:bifunctional ADP-heptose synthase (sugar kinase/adenylyltransferase)